jgi:1-phosphofructokinase family hexose kinase
VLIAGPNLTLDRILRIDELRPGEILRFSDAKIAPGGKGVNVARVARELEYPAVLVVLAPGRTGRAAVELLEAEGLEVQVVPTEGEVRAASTVLERSGRVTVLNEPGPRITSADWEAFERTVANRLVGHRFLVCIGSIPPGAPTEAYARLVSLARAREARTLVDAAGDVLATALGSRPDIVSPNLGEADQILHGGAHLPAKDHRAEVHERAMEAAAGLVHRGAQSSVVTVGAGVAAHRGSKRMWIDAPQVVERNPIGAGDSLVGGLVGALEGGDDFDAAVRLGVAAASASVETDLPGFVDPERVRALYAKLKV